MNGANNIEFLGKDPKVTQAIHKAEEFAVNNRPILIMGEVGLGKVTLAHHIHESSSVRNGPLLLVDCQDDPNRVEDKILGYRDDATGRFHKGVLERGNGGSIILANIDGIHENFQKKIYKIFQDLSDYDINLRIICTTTKNLSKLVGSGRFYRALYVYLSEQQISIPPLRERKDDLIYLTDKLVEKIGFEKNRPRPEIAPDAFDKIQNYYWSHNINELEEIIQKCYEEGYPCITSEKLIIGERKSLNSQYDTGDDGIRLMSLKEAEKLLIRKALIHTSENRTQAAKILGVSIRTLRNKINEYRNDGANYFVNLR